MSAGNSNTWNVVFIGLGTLLAAGCHCVNRTRCVEERCLRECPAEECVVESPSTPPTACVQPYDQSQFAPAPPNHVRQSPNGGYRGQRTILHRVRYGLRKLNRSDEPQNVVQHQPQIAPPSPPANGTSDRDTIVTRPARLGTADDPNAIEPWPFTADDRPIAQPRQLESDDRRPAEAAEAWRYQSARHVPADDRSTPLDPPGRQTITPRPTSGHSAGPRLGSAPRTTDTGGNAARPLWRSTSYQPPPFRGGREEPVIRNFR